jgi:ABC-type uncharacterized transport system substrate-binding protein
MRRRDFLSVLGGAAVAWASVSRAQPLSTPVIGFMSGRSPDESAVVAAAFLQGLAGMGFIGGRNIAIEYRWARGQYDRLPALAADLVKRGVSVLVAMGGELAATAAKQATAAIPIVFGIGSDPVSTGLIASLNRPGGNMTGFTLLTNEMEPKRLGLLHDLIPGVDTVGVLVNPNFPPAERQLAALEAAARTINQKLVVAKAGKDAELTAAFASLVERRAGALLVASDPYFDTRRDRIIVFAAQNRLPAIYHFRDYAVSGGLISYGPNITELYRQAGVYTGRILKGDKPSDLPVVQPTKFEFVINLKTAKALGLTIPAGLISFADEAIE